MADELVELLTATLANGNDKVVILSEAAKIIAEYLIANGVTIPVRCKDCRYCQQDSHGMWCFNDYGHDLQPDDFCSYGERRDGVTNG